MFTAQVKYYVHYWKITLRISPMTSIIDDFCCNVNAALRFLEVLLQVAIQQWSWLRMALDGMLRKAHL